MAERSRAVIFIVGVLFQAMNAEKILHVENFLAGVNLSNPKIFHVRNNLDGDVVIQENETASLLVHLSANDIEMDRVKVEYNIIDRRNIVDIQVFISPETTNKWSLIATLSGTSFCLAVIIVVLVFIVVKKRKNKPQVKLASNRGQYAMKELGRAVAEKVATFEKTTGLDKTPLDEIDAKKFSRPVQPSPIIQRKMAKFEQPKPTTNETDGEKEEIITSIKHSQGKSVNHQFYQISGHSQTPLQPGTTRSTRTIVLVLSLLAVALATKTAPKAAIIINVPASFVGNGSKIFFNEDFHGRFIASGSLKERMHEIQQFAVSQASVKVSYLDTCFSSCKFGCDAQVQQCICLRGYEMKQGKCQDLDECTSGRHNCHVQSMCNNNVGGFTCTCNDGFWGNGLTCHACSTKPCPEGFYESESCTRTRDRVCKACSPRCDGLTYESYGCGLKFDRKCVDVSKPLTLSKMENESEHYPVRSGSKLIFLHPEKDHLLLEDLLQLNSSTTTFLVQNDSANETQLHRNSSFYVDVQLQDVNFIPKYNDFDGSKSNENDEFSRVSGFPEVFTKYCRYPAPDHYTVTHNLHRTRQTRVYQATCFEQSRGLCPHGVAPGEFYYFRSLNDACDTAEEAMVCQKKDQRNCTLKEDLDKLYCTNYTKILADAFGIRKFDFLDSPLQSFPTQLCAHAYRSCSVCRDGCSNCHNSNNEGVASCSCCYKNCLHECSTYYSLPDCTRIPKICAKGDTSQFTLTMNKPADLNLQFNCFLEYQLPKTLYTLKYRVRHENGRFHSPWVTKSVRSLRRDENIYSKIQEGTNHLDFLEVTHSTNLDISPLLYLRGQRLSDKEPFAYSVSRLDERGAALDFANVTDSIQFQTTDPFAINTKTWSNGENCQKLSRWPQTLRKPFLDLKPIKLESLKVLAGGEFSYRIQNLQRNPIMTVSISDHQSILRYVLTNSTIRNDETFRSSLTRSNTTWNARISGLFTSCPGFFTLQVIDEIDNTKVIEQDVVILCPEKTFKMDIRVPRKNHRDKERLFSVFLSDSKQKLKLQLALVDKPGRTEKESDVGTGDENPDPALKLMPFYVTTGCVLLCLLALIIYAQVTRKRNENVKEDAAGWKFVKNQDIEKTRCRRLKSNLIDENRLKRRHIILVAFLVAIRIVYSAVFSCTMALTVLALLHGPNLRIILEYQEFVQSKISESNSLALRMDQHREREVKRMLDATEDIQRSCDFYLGLQLKWLHYNITCLIQENHLKIFRKLSDKVAKQVTEKVGELRNAIDGRINEFQGRTKRKLQESMERLQDYGQRVYDNGWFALPRGAYDVKKGTSRRGKRNTAINSSYILNTYHNYENKKSELHVKLQNLFSTRTKRSIADSSFIGFLDFVGLVDQSRLTETEKNIKNKIQFVKDGLADFSEVLKAGKSPEHPFSTILMCPLRFMLNTAQEHMKRGIKKIVDEGEEWAKANAACFVGNFSNFFASNYSKMNPEFIHDDSFSELITYEEVQGLDEIKNITTTNKSSLIEAANEISYFNIEKGDIMEEHVDKHRKELLEREGKMNNVTSVYDSDVFIVTKKAIVGVFVVIDILLLIYRGSKTYQTALSFIQGFEEIVEHDEDEFKEKTLSTRQRTERIVRRVFDFLVETFSKFLTLSKNLQKKITRTNLVPMCAVITASAAFVYLLIAIVFNVINVTVIEEIGGYDLIASRLDTDFNFTNHAIADQVAFINNNDMRLYKESMTETISEYNKMVQEFNRDQQERMDKLNRQLCRLDKDTEKCLDETEVSASLLSFEPQTCILPTLEGTLYEGYDGRAYRERLKQESARFVDAVRDIILNTIYFIVGVICAFVTISVLSFAVFHFFKSRGMVRVRRVHLYKALPPEILMQFHLKSLESSDELDGERSSGIQRHQPKKRKLPHRFLAVSKERSNKFSSAPPILKT